ncbi:MAG: hypothetical protein D6685_09260 [Bacteroidetes bacterium]|nr:MAG: hypothetical protein D6685_09260 [Bacteroidota bacterium]
MYEELARVLYATARVAGVPVEILYALARGRPPVFYPGPDIAPLPGLPRYLVELRHLGLHVASERTGLSIYALSRLLGLGTSREYQQQARIRHLLRAGDAVTWRLYLRLLAELGEEAVPPPGLTCIQTIDIETPC